jgi:hypothetical protein
MKTTLMSSYTYDSAARLHKWDDPRRGPTNEWYFGYDSSSRITSMSPSGATGWNLAYQPLPGESSGVTSGTGRLKSVKRYPNYPPTEQVTWTVAYGVPLSGAAAPHQMSECPRNRVGMSELERHAHRQSQQDRGVGGSRRR